MRQSAGALDADQRASTERSSDVAHQHHGPGSQPAADNARQLADYMLIQSTMQQQRAPRDAGTIVAHLPSEKAAVGICSLA